MLRQLMPGAVRKIEPILPVWCFVFFVLRFVLLFDQESWGAPLPGKPSDRGQFGFPAETGAAPITGAPAAHCLKLLRHGLENLAGSDQKHHEYVLVLDCTVAGEFGDSFYGQARVACKLLSRQGVNFIFEVCDRM